MPNPYLTEPYKDGYSFITTSGVFYYAFFTTVEASYFPTLGELNVEILTFGFAPLNEKDFETLPSDNRIGITIIKILTEIFENDKTILLFVIENADGKHDARNKIFRKWHKLSASKNIEKFDGVVELSDGGTVLSSLLVHADNAHKQIAVYEFYSLIGQLNKST